MSIFADILDAYKSVPETDDSSVMEYLLSKLTQPEREIWEAQAEVYLDYAPSPGSDPDDISQIEPALLEIERRRTAGGS